MSQDLRMKIVALLKQEFDVNQKKPNNLYIEGLDDLWGVIKEILRLGFEDGMYGQNNFRLMKEELNKHLFSLLGSKAIDVCEHCLDEVESRNEEEDAYDDTDNFDFFYDSYLNLGQKELKIKP